MKITISITPMEKEEEVYLYVHSMNSPIVELVQPFTGVKPVFFKNDAGRQEKVLISDILYFESVDKKTFVYLSNAVYEADERLYQLEEKYSRFHFCRISKSVIINLKQIRQIYPTFSGRFEVILENEERLSISRSYAKNLKERLGGTM